MLVVHAVLAFEHKHGADDTEQLLLLGGVVVAEFLRCRLVASPGGEEDSFQRGRYRSNQPFKIQDNEYYYHLLKSIAMV